MYEYEIGYLIIIALHMCSNAIGQCPSPLLPQGQCLTEDDRGCPGVCTRVIANSRFKRQNEPSSPGAQFNNINVSISQTNDMTGEGAETNVGMSSGRSGGGGRNQQQNAQDYLNYDDFTRGSAGAYARRTTPNFRDSRGMYGNNDANSQKFNENGYPEDFANNGQSTYSGRSGSTRAYSSAGFNSNNDDNTHNTGYPYNNYQGYPQYPNNDNNVGPNQAGRPNDQSDPNTPGRGFTEVDDNNQYSRNQYSQGPGGIYPELSNNRYPQGYNNQYPQGNNNQSPQGSNDQYRQGANNQYPDVSNNQYPQGPNQYPQDNGNGFKMSQNLTNLCKVCSQFFNRGGNTNNNSGFQNGQQQQGQQYPNSQRGMNNFENQGSQGYNQYPGAFTGQSGQYPQQGSGGQYSQQGPNSQYPQQGSNAQYPQQGSGGQYPQQGSSGQYSQQGFNGQYPQQGSNGQYPQQGSNGQYPQQGSNGQYPQQGSNGQYPQQGSNGQIPQQGSNGQYPKQGSNGQYSQQGSNGQYPQRGSNGQYPQQGSSGQYSQQGSDRQNPQQGTNGQYPQNSNGNYPGQSTNPRGPIQGYPNNEVIDRGTQGGGGVGDPIYAGTNQAGRGQGQGQQNTGGSQYVCCVQPDVYNARQGSSGQGQTRLVSNQGSNTIPNVSCPGGMFPSPEPCWVGDKGTCVDGMCQGSKPTNNVQDKSQIGLCCRNQSTTSNNGIGLQTNSNQNENSNQNQDTDESTSRSGPPNDNFSSPPTENISPSNVNNENMLSKNDDYENNPPSIENIMAPSELDMQNNYDNITVLPTPAARNEVKCICPQDGMLYSQPKSEINLAELSQMGRNCLSVKCTVFIRGSQDGKTVLHMDRGLSLPNNAYTQVTVLDQNDQQTLIHTSEDHDPFKAVLQSSKIAIVFDMSRLDDSVVPPLVDALIKYHTKPLSPQSCICPEATILGRKSGRITIPMCQNMDCVIILFAPKEQLKSDAIFRLDVPNGIQQFVDVFASSGSDRIWRTEKKTDNLIHPYDFKTYVSPTHLTNVWDTSQMLNRTKKNMGMIEEHTLDAVDTHSMVTVHYHTQSKPPTSNGPPALYFEWEPNCSCGESKLNATETKQPFSSPRFPDEYCPRLNCAWEIKAPEGQHVALQIDSLLTEQCCDFLSIVEDPNNQASTTRLSGSDPGKAAFISIQNILLVRFNTNGGRNYEGFSFHYWSVAAA